MNSSFKHWHYAQDPVDFPDAHRGWQLTMAPQ